MVKEALHRALDARPEEFLVEVAWPHAELIVHLQGPLDRRLKFIQPIEQELARELLSVVSELVDSEFGPVRKA